MRIVQTAEKQKYFDDEARATSNDAESDDYSEDENDEHKASVHVSQGEFFWDRVDPPDGRGSTKPLVLYIGHLDPSLPVLAWKWESVWRTKIKPLLVLTRN